MSDANFRKYAVLANLPVWFQILVISLAVSYPIAGSYWNYQQDKFQHGECRYDSKYEGVVSYMITSLDKESKRFKHVEQFYTKNATTLFKEHVDINDKIYQNSEAQLEHLNDNNADRRCD